MKPCKGTNCGCIDGVSHSPECRAEHESIVNAAAMADHIERIPPPWFGVGRTETEIAEAHDLHRLSHALVDALRIRY